MGAMLMVMAVEARAAAEAAKLVVQQVASTGGVPTVLTKVLIVLAVEVTSTVPSSWFRCHDQFCLLSLSSRLSR